MKTSKRIFLSVCILIIVFPFHISAQTSPQLLKNVFKLELEFGANDLPNEYLLVEPHGLAVHPNGDVYVFDEGRIKVFENTGKPKKIIGRPGQGPGEFEAGKLEIEMVISPSGFLTVHERHIISTFDPNNKFLDRFNIVFMPHSKEFYSTSNSTAYTYILPEKDVLLSSGHNANRLNPNKPYYEFLYIDKDGNSKEIVKYEVTGIFPFSSGRGGGDISNDLLGRLYFALLPNKRIVLSHSNHDVVRQEPLGKYILHIIDFNGVKERDIVQTFIPELIPVPNKPRNTSNWSAEEKQAREDLYNMIKKLKYKSPFHNIVTDRNYIFVINQSYAQSKYYYIDVFDGELGKLISHFEAEKSSETYKNNFSYVFANGFAYERNTNKDGFKIIRIYRINPQVYGK